MLPLGNLYERYDAPVHLGCQEEEPKMGQGGKWREVEIEGQLPDNQRSEEAYVDVFEGNRSMVPLEHQRVLRRFGNRARGASRPVDGDIFLDHLTVEQHAL